MNQHRMRHQKLIKPYPTHSLREFLAHRSLNQSQPSFQCDNESLQIEVDIGDGRREILCVNGETDIEESAQKICQKYELQPYVGNLLAQTLREQYQRQITEQSNKKTEEVTEQLRQIYTSNTAHEVLIDDQDVYSKKVEQKQTYTYESYEKESLWRPIEAIDNDKQNTPVINTVSKLICQKYGKDNILKWKQQKSREKREAIRKQKELKQQADMKECLFKPKINTISQKVDRQLNDYSVREDKKVLRYELLYANYQNLQAKKAQRQEKILAEHSYKPQINPISRLIVQNKQNCDSLSVSKHSHNHCRQSGSQVTRPKTGRKPQNRNKRGLPIGQYLYQQGRRFSKPEVEIKSEFKALQHSEFLVSTLKEKRLKQIFIELTKPPHQELFPSDLPYSYQIFQGPFRLLLPLFIQIQQLGVVLSQQNFLEAGLKLIESLSPDERHELLFKKTILLPQNSSNYDDNSQQSRTISRQSSGDLYSRGLAMARQKENKIEKSRQKQVRQQLKKCTFRPIIHR